MAGISVFLCCLTLAFLVLTRETRINLIKEKTWRIEIHLTVFSIHLFPNRNSDTEKKKRKNKDNSIPKISYFRIISRLLDLFEVTEITVKELAVAQHDKDFNRTVFTKPYRYHTAISAAIAYLEQKTQKLTIADNAIKIVSGDDAEFKINISIKLILYQLIFAVLYFKYDIRKIKRKKAIS